MSFFDWIKRRGLAGLIPKNARAQFLKWRKLQPEMSEAEIAQGIFSLRYGTATPTLDADEMTRFSSYMDGGFECSNLLEFCLASLDIEGGISPSDEEAFLNVATFIERELIRAGHVVKPDDGQNFANRWWECVAPFRSLR